MEDGEDPSPNQQASEMASRLDVMTTAVQTLRRIQQILRTRLEAADQDGTPIEFPRAAGGGLAALLEEMLVQRVMQHSLT
eukprot:gene19384-6618_t